jgi:hypothetical protein
MGHYKGRDNRKRRAARRKRWERQCRKVALSKFVIPPLAEAFRVLTESMWALGPTLSASFRTLHEVYQQNPWPTLDGFPPGTVRAGKTDAAERPDGNLDVRYNFEVGPFLAECERCGSVGVPRPGKYVTDPMVCAECGGPIRPPVIVPSLMGQGQRFLEVKRDD